MLPCCRSHLICKAGCLQYAFECLLQSSFMELLCCIPCLQDQVGAHLFATVLPPL